MVGKRSLLPRYVIDDILGKLSEGGMEKQPIARSCLPRCPKDHLLQLASFMIPPLSSHTAWSVPCSIAYLAGNDNAGKVRLPAVAVRSALACSLYTHFQSVKQLSYSIASERRRRQQQEKFDPTVRRGELGTYPTGPWSSQVSVGKVGRLQIIVQSCHLNHSFSSCSTTHSLIRIITKSSTTAPKLYLLCLSTGGTLTGHWSCWMDESSVRFPLALTDVRKEEHECDRALGGGGDCAVVVQLSSGSCRSAGQMRPTSVRPRPSVRRWTTSLDRCSCRAVQKRGEDVVLAPG